MVQTTIVFVAAVAGVVFVTLPYDSGGGVIMMGAAIALISIVFLPKLAPKEDRKFLTSILILALVAKLAATGFRLFMNEVVYGSGDFNRFDVTGTIVAERIRSGDLTAAFDGFAVGTASMEILTGIFYSITGPSFFGMFFVGGFLGFLGAVFYYRAFRIAFPNGRYKLYAALIFFYPAVLYWPTGMGKDLVTFVALGITVWAAARFILQSWLPGVWIAVFGLLVAFLIRPEIGLVASIAFITAFVLRKPARNRKAFAIQLIGVPAVLLVGFIVISQATSFLGVENLSPDGVLQLITDQSSKAIDEGRRGSNFTPPTVGTATWIPEVFVTVFFRPFPWEVHNLQALVQSFDGTLLGGILIISLPGMIRSIKSEGQNPIFIFAIVFILMSVIALGTLGNFGLLARQRVIVLPFLFFVVSASQMAVNSRRSESVDEPGNPVSSRAPIGAGITG